MDNRKDLKKKGDRAVIVKESPAVTVAKKKAAEIVAEAEKADKDQTELNKAFKANDAVVFISTYKELCVTMKPILVKVNALGVSEIVSPGVDLQFHNGVYSTTDKEEIEYIKSRPMFGSKIQIAKANPADVKTAVQKVIDS